MTEATEQIEQAAAWKEILNRQHLPKIATLSMAIWLHAANSMLTATTLPSAVGEIGGLHLMSWAFALYLMGSIISAASISLIVLNYGLRKTMIYAALVYAVGCLICAIAPAMPVLLMGRMTQGLGGGALVALVYIAQDRFFPNRFVPKIVACFSAIWMTAAFCGPMIGGAFATWGLWRMAFWVFAIQAVLLIIAIQFLLKTEEPKLNIKEEKIPIVRLLFLATAILSISMAGAHFDLFRSPFLILVGCAAIGLFLIRDKRAKNSRMLPLETTDLNHKIGSGIAMTFVYCLSIMSFIVYGPLILITLYDLTPFAAGFVVLMETLGWSCSAILFSGVSPAYERRLIRTGGMLVVTGLILQAIFLPIGPLWLVVICAFVSNSGFGMMWGFIIKRIVGAAEPQEKDRAGSLLPTAQQMGFALGAALSGLIANGLGASESMSMEKTQTIAFWLFAGFVPVASLGLLFGWRFTRAGKQ